MSNTAAKGCNSCQFFLTDEEAAAVRDITKVDSLGPAALAIVRKAIESARNK